MKLAIDNITIAGRHRKDLGDVQALADSMKSVGLLQPIVVTNDNRLIAGERRIAAAKLLGWESIEVFAAGNFDDATKALRAERDENTCRKDFTPMEAVAVGREIEKMERPKAAERQFQAAGRPQGQKVCSGNLPEQKSGTETREKVGAALGMSGTTYQRAKAVVAAAENEPDKFSDLARRMESGETSINAAHNELRARKPAGSNGHPATSTTLTKKRAGQRKAPAAIRAAIGTMVGIATGLDSFAVSDADPSSAEAAEWEKDLADVVAAINRFRREIKHYAKECDHGKEAACSKRQD